MEKDNAAFEINVLKNRIAQLEIELSGAKEAHSIRCNELQEMTRLAQEFRNINDMNVKMGQELCERLAIIERRRGGECSICKKWVCPPLTCYGCRPVVVGG